jgi:hypothetical protein
VGHPTYFSLNVGHPTFFFFFCPTFNDCSCIPTGSLSQCV